MKFGVLFSGGKDSTYAMYLAKKSGHEISCLISVFSKNQDSFMFHTPSINLVEEQSKLLQIPIIIQTTKGEKEKELLDLKNVIETAKKKYEIQGIVTGALESVYQASRIQKICNELKIECFNPLWKKNQIELLKELLKNNFEIIISGVAGYPLDKNWIGRNIDDKFISEVEILQKKFQINPAGEGGEFESLVLNCPMFKKRLNVKLKNVVGEKNSWRGEWE